MPDASPDDIAHMRAALALARRGLGNVWPNPSVGCVIVRDGRVLARAVTATGGRPHAEQIALGLAGDPATGRGARPSMCRSNPAVITARRRPAPMR
jgi:diaminohydroxyphosphoribosylaminopyrimidine deaminase/5-amino-6-(5-phosphoribosylamino)uracil reductase